MTPAEAYRKAAEPIGGMCPVEAGLLGSLADNECRHGNLPGDRVVDCDCWPRWRDQPLRRRRQAFGIRVPELAKASGVHPHTLWKIDGGHRQPTAATVEAIERGFAALREAA